MTNLNNKKCWMITKLNDNHEEIQSSKIIESNIIDRLVKESKGLKYGNWTYEKAKDFVNLYKYRGSFMISNNEKVEYKNDKPRKS